MIFEFGRGWNLGGKEMMGRDEMWFMLRARKGEKEYYVV